LVHETGALDAFDLRLLKALQVNGRLTNQEAGETIGLSASQCSRRRAALEEAGVIEGYHALLSTEKLGLRLLAIIQVTLKTHSGDNARRFRDLIGRVEEILEAYAVTGDTDYQLKVIVPDLSALNHLINDVLLVHESVARVRSAIVLDRLKATAHLPLDHAIARGRE
jgi:DNA-binding Lrp family transcriptional regulator